MDEQAKPLTPDAREGHLVFFPSIPFRSLRDGGLLTWEHLEVWYNAKQQNYTRSYLIQR